MRSRKVFWRTASIIILLVLLFTMIIIIGYNNFAQHRNTVIRQQQEHLLTIAKSISRSLDAFINDKADSLYLLAQNPIITKALEINEVNEAYSQHDEVLQAFYKKYSYEMESVLLLDAKGSQIYQYPAVDSVKEKSIDASIISRILKSKQAIVSKEYQSSANQFSIDILQPVFKNNEVSGILLCTINLNKIYNNLIHPIRPGKKGYAMVKNMNDAIIMHPVPEQIGIESTRVRKEKFPEFDWKELEELNRKQVEEGEGYYVYHSRWWQDNDSKRTKKINVYTTIKISDISWIISVQMDYAEIEAPIRGTLINISLIALIITAVLIIVIYIILKIDKKRKALEIETKYLKELNKTWEELIRSEARLRHSQKLQTIGTLTSGIAHEFNNLLTPILGYSEILLQSIDNKDDMHQDISEINKSALRAKEIIEQILVFSRNDNVISKVKYLSVASVVKESIKLIKSILPNNIKIVENINSKELILGSATQLQQVLLNLYTNSYHAMKNNGGVLELNVENVYIADEESVEVNLSKGKYVKTQVKDTGIGMNQETLNRIFDPFFTTKEIGEGTGLGLSVVHGIVKNHNGCIIVKSEIGVGTTVDIYLPAAEEAIDVIQQENEISAEGVNILAIDDNTSVLKMIEKGLNSFGYNVITENDGYEAMKLIDKDLADFRVVILDYAMPNISGLEIARYLKMKNPNIKIILVSGYIKEDITLNYQNLFDDYMLKPILIPELVYKIKQLQLETK
jgi:two-component system, cell cycle sensor histidine kinase and response regulator CckA